MSHVQHCFIRIISGDYASGFVVPILLGQCEESIFICTGARYRTLDTNDIWRFFFVFRQMVARTVLDTLRQVADTREEVESVFHIVARLAQDVGKFRARALACFCTCTLNFKRSFVCSE